MHKQQTNYSFFFSEAIFKQHSVNWKYIFPTLLSCFNVWSSLSWVYHVSRPIMIIVTQHKPDKAPGGLDTWWWQLTPDGGHLLTSCHSLQIYKSRKFRRHLDSRARRSASPDARVSLCHHWCHICHMSQSLSCTSSSLKLATVPLGLMWDWVTPCSLVTGLWVTVPSVQLISPGRAGPHWAVYTSRGHWVTGPGQR